VPIKIGYKTIICQAAWVKLKDFMVTISRVFTSSLRADDTWVKPGKVSRRHPIVNPLHYGRGFFCLTTFILNFI
jgi:hypothetical protein